MVSYDYPPHALIEYYQGLRISVLEKKKMAYRFLRSIPIKV